VAEVYPEDVAALLGHRSAADQAIPIVTVMAKAYTRGRGFTDNEPNDEIAAVITTASARLAVNGEQLSRKRVDDVEVEYSLRGSFGWTLAELFVLNRYRVTAM
jgi:hypothetical protein